MGTNRTPNKIRGFLLPWPFTTSSFWNGESTFTQQGPHAGFAEAQGNYDLVVQTTGEMVTDANITLLTQQGGHVGNSKFVWKHGVDTLYYGRNGGNVLSYYEIVEASTSSTNYRDISDALGLSTGEAIAISRNRIVGTNYKTVVYKRNSIGVFSSTDLYTQSNSTPMHGALCKLPDDSLLAAFYVANTTTNTAQVRIHRSVDKGSTWSVISTQALPVAIDISGAFGAGNPGYDLSRLRMNYAQGQLLLLCGLRQHDTAGGVAATDVIAQYASTDNGGSFTHVVTSDGAQGYYSFDLLVKNNNFFLTYIAGSDNAKILPLSHAFVSIDIVRGYGTTYNIYPGSLTIAGGLTNKYWTTGQMSCWKDEAGRFWASIQDLTNNGQISIGLSDDVENWYYLGGDIGSGTKLPNAVWYNIGSANTAITAHAGCSSNGRQIVFCNFTGQGVTTTYRGSLSMICLGGWSAVTMPRLTTYPNDWDYSGFSYNWLPFDLPVDTTHYTQSGAGSAILGSGKMTLDCTTGQTKYYESPSQTKDKKIIIRARLKPIAEGVLTGGRGFEYRSGDYWGAVYVSVSSIALYDQNQTTQIGASASFTANSSIDILFSMEQSKVSLWYCVDTKIEKQWILVASGTLGTNVAIGDARIRFGNITGLALGGGASVDTEWFGFHYSFDTAAGEGLSTGQTNPGDLKGRLYPPQSEFVYVTGGMSVSTYEGPAFEGENYDITTQYDYPIGNIIYSNSPSPRSSWRSLSVTSGAVPEQKIAFFLDDNVGNNANSSFGSDLVGIHFSNINFRSFSVHRYNQPTASWVAVGTFTNQVVSHAFTRSGASLLSNNGTGPYLQFDECKNWYVVLVDGATTRVRKLRTNSEGVFSNSTTTKKAILTIEEPDNTDPTSGTLYLVPNACTITIDLQGNTLAALRITIDSQYTNENYINVGGVSIGSIVIPAYQYSRGRSISFDSGVITEVSKDGVQRTRDYQAGGRTYRIAWSEGVDITELFKDPASPDFYVATDDGASKPIAAIGSAPTAMMGVIRYLSGPKKPLVYLPSIDYLPSPVTTQIFNRRMAHCHCTLEGEISIENVLGDELDDEVMRVGTVQLREVR